MLLSIPEEILIIIQFWWDTGSSSARGIFYPIGKQASVEKTSKSAIAIGECSDNGE